MDPTELHLRDPGSRRAVYPEHGEFRWLAERRPVRDAEVTAPPLPPFNRSDSINSSVTGFGDLYPAAVLQWHDGVNNFMVYGTGDIPVGAYDSMRLANLGIGHGAADGGVGYTYLNPATGHEFSAVAGLTYNLENPSTNYKNGVDFHLDWAASQYLWKQIFVGPVGYVYDQLSCDSGAGDRVGCFESRVVGIGPQIGYLFPIGVYPCDAWIRHSHRASDAHCVASAFRARASASG